MNRRFSLLLTGFCLLLFGFSPAALADSSHARIVRLSLVQGDVRFASSFQQDPLTDAKAGWQAAPLNLPIRQGFVLATDNGRAEVEFENGAMIFLGPSTVVEFYDLSLQDGARITRLVLRQGTAITYVNPANGDYFSLTGGDFTVEATTRARFRLDNFDDGSTVNVEQGRVSVLRDKQTTPLSNGQSLSAHTNDADNLVIGRAADLDDFDHWVSGRIDSVVTATNYSNQYVNSPGYSSGFADLYTYGSWYSMAGYGYCWRPFGVGLGWSPFDYGSWYNDPFFGYTFIGYAPWGWLPYHYGGWVFSPVYGWVWAPVGFGGYSGPRHYHPITATWVRNGTTVGIVPLHPGDKPGKTAQNLGQGIYTVQNMQVARNSLAPAAAGPGKWAVISRAPTEVLSSSVAASSAPVHVSRTIVSGTSTSNRVVGFGRESSITYDPVEHRYVNSGNPNAAQQPAESHTTLQPANGAHTNTAVNGPVVHGPTAVQTPAKPVVPAAPASARVGTPPRAPAVPAPAHTGGGGAPGTASWGGRSSSGSHPSFGGSGSSSGSHPSGGSSGGGSHPH
jgi:hypothetical protein